MNDVLIRRLLGALVLLLAAFLLASLVPDPQLERPGDRGRVTGDRPEQVVRYDLKGGPSPDLKLDPDLEVMDLQGDAPATDPGSGASASGEDDSVGAVDPGPVAATPQGVRPEAARPAERPAAPAGPAVWLIQVGSFADPANARAVRDRLAAEKLPASVQEVKVGRAQWYRVRLGPFQQESAAKKALDRVKALDYRGARMFQDSGQ